MHRRELQSAKRRTWKEADRIEEYQFIFNRDGSHVGVAKRESGQLDIYYNGNHIDDAVDDEGEAEEIEGFCISYDRIFFDLGGDRPERLGFNEVFDIRVRTSPGFVVANNELMTERIKHTC